MREIYNIVDWKADLICPWVTDVLVPGILSNGANLFPPIDFMLSMRAVTGQIMTLLSRGI